MTITSKLTKKIARMYFLFLSWLIFSLPVFVFSSSHTTSGNTDVTLNNPLKVGTIEELLAGILTIVMVIATPIIIFFIIYAGFLYVTAQGNPEKIKEAHRAITYAVIGGVIIIGALAIGEIIKNLVAAF